jgi:hypothetical protein
VARVASPIVALALRLHMGIRRGWSNPLGKAGRPPRIAAKPG